MYKIGKANVRVHGEIKKDQIHNAVATFIKKVEQQKSGGKT